MNVKVKVPILEVSIVNGFQLPVIPLVEVNGNVPAVVFWQISAIGSKRGTIGASIVTSIVNGVAHWPTAGVNV